MVCSGLHTDGFVIMCLLLDRDVGSPFVTGALVGAEIAVGGSKCCY